MLGRAAVWLASAGCSTLTFPCHDSAQCGVGDERGVCQPDGFCSLRDPGCPEGWRTVEHAPEGRADRCVDLGPLVGRWAFDDGQEGIAVDSSGNGHDGALVQGPTWVPGVTGDAISFDGVDDRVEITGIAPFGSSGFSGFAWVKSTDGDDETELQGRIFGVYFDELGSYAFLNFGAGAPFLEAYDSDHTYWGAGANAGTDLADDRWHHVGIVIDRETEETRFYLDGVFQSRTPTSSSGLFGMTEPGGFLIGGQNDAEPTALEATIDEVRLYGAALREDQVRALYDADAP